MNRLFMFLPLLGLTFLPQLGRGAEPDAKQNAHADAFLGIAIESVPDALHKQLPDVLPEGQGLLVGQVLEDSPAAKAGLKPFDVLKTYGDKTLTSPEALIKLIQADKPGEEVAIGYVRAGKAATCKVTLGENGPGHERNSRRQIFRRSIQDFARSNDAGVWDTFDAISLRTSRQ